MTKIIIPGPEAKIICKNRKNAAGNTVKIIPAITVNGRQKSVPGNPIKLNVAGYCRVSTAEESQQGSFLSQELYLRSLIENNSDWKLVGIYKDENRSGTNRFHRPGFNQMMEDAKAGKIDYIITKSISRFARNTVDTLDCIHELRNRNPPVGVLFIKENIFTLNRNYDMMLTIMAELAQNESYSIAENIRWGLRKRFRNGIPQINLKRMMGYDMGNGGEWIVNPKQAKIVRFIYARYLQGRSAHGISVELNDTGVKTVNGKKWCTTGILCILQNEKYAGDLIIQKTYTKDVLNHRPVENNGELPRYYIPDHHEAIICREDWIAVQEKICGKARKRKKYNMVQQFIMKEAGAIE